MTCSAYSRLFKGIPTALFLMLAQMTMAQSPTVNDAWINEIHYDNTGTDAGEGVEIAVADVSAFPLSEFSIVLYNGSDGLVYGSFNFSTPDSTSVSNGFTLAWKSESGIQNGAPDGMALVHNDGVTETVIQLLSYEGSFTALDGPAIGMTSVDIGQSQGNAPSSQTLQLSGTGSTYTDFTWQADAQETRSKINNGQSLVGFNNDSDTEIIPPNTQVAAKTIVAADVTTQTSAEEVLVFRIVDKASGDGLPTDISTIRLTPGSNNTADWSDHIGGIYLQTSIYIYPSSILINDAFIELYFDPGDVVIADSANEVVYIWMYLNETNIDDGAVLQFEIDGSSHGFSAFSTGSWFANTMSSDVIGNDITINVVNTELQFLSQPASTIVNIDMNPVTVGATDANGNIDTSYGNSINLTSTGTTALATYSETAINGIATFSNIVHTAIGNGLQLTVDDGSLSSTSDLFNIISDVPTLIISEIADPSDAATSRFIELYNYGPDTIDLAQEDMFIALQSNGGSVSDVKLTGKIAPNDIYVVGQLNSNNFQQTFNFTPHTLTGTVNGNGNDGYFLFFNGGYNTGILLDIFGEVDVDGSGRPWEYEDSRAIRKNPRSASPSSTWNSSEWTILPAVAQECTPGALENEYRYSVIGGVGKWKPTRPYSSVFLTDTITITGDTSSAGNLICSQFDIREGYSFDVSPTNYIEIDNQFVNNGNLHLLADATGYSQLKLNGTYSGVGIVAQQQYTNVEGWHPIGAPFTNTPVDSLGDQVNDYGNLFYWNETNYDYEVEIGNFIPGRGYTAYFGNFGVSSDSNGPWTFELSGTPVTSLTPTLDYQTAANGSWNSFNGNNPNQNGWNLIANPFNCNLDFETLSLSNVENSFYKYNENNNSWRSFSAAGTVNSEIAPLQGFWVRATNTGTPSVGTLTPAANGTVSNPANFFKQSFDRIVLEVEANEKNDQLVFALIPNTTDGFDADWDAWKMENGSGVPNLYSHEGNEDMAINAVPMPTGQQSVHDVGIRCDSLGSFTIRMDTSFWDVSSPYQVWLYDAKTGIEHDILNSDYTFAHDTSFTELRFELRIRDPFFELEEMDTAQFALLTAPDEWIIENHQELKGVYTVYSQSGQKVASGRINRSREKISNAGFSSGIYLIEIQSEFKVQTLKATKR